MVSKKKSKPKKAQSNKLGHDPLEWMKDDSRAKVDGSNDGLEIVEKESMDNIDGRSMNIVLPEVFNITKVSALKSEYQQTVEQATDVLVIDGSQVKTVDASSVQLLLSTFEYAKTRKIKCKFERMSEKLRESIKYLGLSKQLR